MLNPETRRTARTSGQLKNRVEGLKNPWRQSSPLLLNYNETSRLALDALLEKGEKGYIEVLDEEKELQFLSSLDIGFICNSADVNRDNDDSFGPHSPSSDRCLSEITSGTYFPLMSDIDIPELELGWPEIPLATKTGKTEVQIIFQRHRSNEIKDLIRSLINKARMVIAVVMDLFTDVDILCDLVEAASKRKVPVYILLDEKNLTYFIEMFEKLSFNKIYFPNMKIRTVTGDTYCTKSGKKFSGQFLEKFIMIDSEHVVTGAYSFSWLSSHVHRNLATYLKGNIVEEFDREFRCLYAESLVADYFSNIENESNMQSGISRNRWAVKKTPPRPPPIPERPFPSDTNSSSGSQSSVKTPTFHLNEAITVIHENQAKTSKFISNRVNEEFNKPNVDIFNGQRRQSDPCTIQSKLEFFLKPVNNDKNIIQTSPQLTTKFSYLQSKPLQPKINSDAVTNKVIKGPEDKKDTATEDTQGNDKKQDKRRTLGHSNLDLITKAHNMPVINKLLPSKPSADSEVKKELAKENDTTNKINRQTLGHSKLDLILQAQNLPGNKALATECASSEAKAHKPPESNFEESRRMTLGHSRLDLITQSNKDRKVYSRFRP
ncbi:protein FAM83C [Bombina bombina]|uniref:protein FAM83C n=1 Tax=Bombina bombina TaxID=8345 RepID=UPI00235A656F|nr:protein FAM83C [Bombina bombina]